MKEYTSVSIDDDLDDGFVYPTQSPRRVTENTLLIDLGTMDFINWVRVCIGKDKISKR